MVYSWRAYQLFRKYVERGEHCESFNLQQYWSRWWLSLPKHFLYHSSQLGRMMRDGPQNVVE
jgi:hypothetical protein